MRLFAGLFRYVLFIAIASISVCHFSAQAEDIAKIDNFHLPDGLEAQVWAQSPMFFNPTNIDVDHRGRMWVVEAVNYRGFNNKNKGKKWHGKGDRVVILEDTTGDGRADKSTVFVQDPDLIAPLGIAVFDNQVLVSCSPSLILYTDVNRDGRFDPAVDKKEKLLTGFGGKDHDHSLHSVVSGPDGAWYLATGNAGPHVVTDRAGWTLRAGSSYTGGSPYNPKNQPGLKSDDGRVWVGGVALRFQPNGKGLSVIGHNFRNCYELCLDSFGSVYQNDCYRAEQFNGKVVQILDMNKKRGLLLDTDQKVAVKITFSEKPAKEFFNPMENLRHIQVKDAENLGEEKLNGVRTQVYRVRKFLLLGESDRARDLKVWIDPKTSLPVKMIEKIVENQTVLKTRSENFVWDKPIDPKLLSLDTPDGYRLLGEMDEEMKPIPSKDSKPSTKEQD